MRYIEHGAGGTADVLTVQEAPIPEPASGEVLIEVYFAGVNRPDVVQRQGKYPAPLGASPILGLEVSGQIVKVGADLPNLPYQIQLGDWVCALTPGGAYAQYVVAPAAHCLPLPCGLSVGQAAALPENYFTVWSNLFNRGRFQEGDSLLVHGGSSGIGLTAIQLARAFGASQIYTTVGSQAKADAVIAYGADYAIPYHDKDFVEMIQQHTAGKGVDVVLDIVAGDYADRNLRCLSLDGRLIQISLMQAPRSEISVQTLMAKRLTWTGSTLRPQSISQKALIAKQLYRHVWPLLESGRCLPVIDAIYPLAQAAAAHRKMESSAHIGKLLLAVK